MRGGVTDAGRTNNEQTLKIELLSQWKLEAEFRKWSKKHQMNGIVFRLPVHKCKMGKTVPDEEKSEKAGDAGSC